MPNLNAQELQHLETFVTTSLADPGSLTHEELLETIAENQELCARAVRQLQETPRPRRMTEEDYRFLESWLKARHLVIGGMQLLQLADPENHDRMQHEVECTETALTLTPGLIADARG